MKKAKFLFVIFLSIFLGQCISFCYITINAVEYSNNNNWVEINLVNPSINMTKVKSWIYFETDLAAATEGHDEWKWFFYKYEIWIKEAYLYGYKNPDIREFEVHIVSFKTKFAGKKQWSGGLKDFEVNIKCGRISLAPDYDYSKTIDPFPHPADQYEKTTVSWGQFGFKYGDNRLLIMLAACFNGIAKATAISSVDFTVS